MRPIGRAYRDPLDQIWSATAERIGLRIERTADVYASTDGRGSLRIAHPEHLDADDSLAQMIFHELCHSLVMGADAFDEPDWGLSNLDARDLTREHACLRVQAALADSLGLRTFLAPTTDHRSFYDGLGPWPLEPREEPSVQLAILAYRRARTSPWWPHLPRALDATAVIARTTRSFPARGPLPSLYLTVEEARAPHDATGLPGGAGAARRCQSCAWRLEEDDLCLQAELPTSPDASACERYEASFDCQDCGACCRAAYHAVEIDDDDPVRARHPELVTLGASRHEIRREGDRCTALEILGSRYACTIYDDRPRCCREFERASLNCLTARRRVGLSL